MGGRWLEFREGGPGIGLNLQDRMARMKNVLFESNASQALSQGIVGPMGYIM